MLLVLAVAVAGPYAMDVALVVHKVVAVDTAATKSSRSNQCCNISGFTW